MSSLEEQIQKYRQNLIVYGKKYALENPDRLNLDELKAVTLKTLQELNKIDMTLGYPNHVINEKLPPNISIGKQEKMFIDFIDWYTIIPTQNEHIYKYVTEHFPIEKYQKVLCVGDGTVCHLGRKLAMHGYTALSVDPIARKELFGISDNLEGYTSHKKGKFRALQAKFFSNSLDMIDWADVIVGSKVPECVQDLIQINNKPVVFNISKNPEIYNMIFNGEKITSYEQFVKEILKASPDIDVIKEVTEYDDKTGPILTFVKNQRIREKSIDDD